MVLMIRNLAMETRAMRQGSYLFYIKVKTTMHGDPGTNTIPTSCGAPISTSG
jgi:hypothetical protein